MLDREAIMSALFTRLTTGLGASINFSSRRFLDFDELGAEQHPAMLVVNTRDSIERAPQGRPAKHHLGAMVVLYVRDDDPTSQPESSLFNLVAQVETALQYQSTDTFTPEAIGSGTTTLGGKVRCTYVRDVEVHHGASGGSSAVTLLLEMLVVES